MAAVKRGKQAYLMSNEIQAKINDGTLDQYDTVFTKDTKEIVYIDKDKVPHSTKSKFDVYSNETIANTTINTLSYTYEGQIVMVFTELDGIKPCVVNLNADTNQYYVIPVNSGHSQMIVDYNNIENVPILNIVADTEIVLSNLADGYYSIVGSYQISPDDATHRISTSRILFTIEHEVSHNEIVTYITEIKGKKIKRYEVKEGSLIEND